MDEKKVREVIERMCKMRDMYNATLCSLPPKTREKSDYNNYVDAFLIAIEALEKQLPKKPIEHCAKFAAFYECPSCGDVDVYGQKNCDNCGQGLDWSE